MEDDPYELNNLIDHPDYTEVVEMMAERLDRKLRETNDKDFYKPISEEFINVDNAGLEELFRRRGLIS